MAVISGLVLGAIALYGAYKGAQTSREAKELADENMQIQQDIASKQLEFQKEQQKKLDLQKEIYRNIEFKNPYEDMENFYEDLTVNQQQAQFQAQQGAQQRADIMQNLQGAAGSSGIASLAQALANQGQLQSQRISADIGAQEARNQLAIARGASAADIAERQGEAMVQQAEMSRQSTLLGMEMGEMAGASAGVQQAYANQMAAGAAQVGALSAEAQSYYGLISGAASAYGGGATTGGGGGGNQS